MILTELTTVFVEDVDQTIIPDNSPLVQTHQIVIVPQGSLDIEVEYVADGQFLTDIRTEASEII